MARKDLMRFDSTDFQLTKLVGALSAAAAAIITVIVPIVRWVRGEPLVALVDSSTAIANPAPGVTVTQGPQMELEFAAPTAMQWLASLIPAAFFVALLAAAVWLLWRLLDDVRAGQPFSLMNVRRLRGIAGVIVFGGFVHFTIEGLAAGYLLRQAGVVDIFLVNESTVQDFLVVGLGFLLAALAEAFRRGIELEDDVEGLV